MRLPASITASLVAVLAATLCSVPPPARSLEPAPRALGVRAAAEPDRPNIVLITSDDQSEVDLEYMPLTRSLLGRSGVEFTDAVNPHPLCCPARAEILTGSYGHNTGVHHNDGRWGGYSAFLANGNRTEQIGQWLSDAGYRTALIGKMMNGYDRPDPRLSGFDYWSPTLQGTYRYYRTTFFNDGDPKRYEKKYVADVVRDQSIGRIRRWSGEDRPFFLWASHVGPHDATQGNVEAAREGAFANPVPADRHRGTFTGVPLPSRAKPSFNAGAAGKPTRIQESSQSRDEAAMQEQFERRVESLQAIDEANAAIIQALADAGELDDTVIVYTSDNGWQYAEHGLVGKNFPYEENLQIPFLMRAPDVAPGQSLPLAATLVDLAPTFLDYAGALPPVRRRPTDGLSLRTVLRDRAMPNDTTLIQAGRSDLPWQFRGVRTGRYTWARWYGDDQYELYDRERDPFQLDNLVDVGTGAPRDDAYAPVVAELQRRFRALRRCAGVRQCEQQDFGPVPPPLGEPGSPAPRRGARVG